IRSQLDGALAHLEQSKRQAHYQVDQTRLGIRQAGGTVRAAEARVQAADEERRMQANLAESAIAQAEANLASALQSQSLLEKATHPQAVVDARSGYEEARAGAERAKRSLERQLMLAGRGYAAAESLDAARADVASAQARLEQTRKRLGLLSEQH